MDQSFIRSPQECSTLVELMRWRSAQQPEFKAYTFLTFPFGEAEEKHLTYGDLDSQARKIGMQLQNLKACGERVLLLYPPGLEYIAAFFGCLYAGAIAVPSYPPRLNRPDPRLQAIVADAKPIVALTDKQILSNLKRRFAHTPELASLHWLATDELNDDPVEDWRTPEVHSDQLAFIQYTSGSTSTPKGVMIRHSNLMHNLWLIHKCFETTEGSRGVSWLPFYHDMGLIGCVLATAYCKVSSVLMSPFDFLQNPFHWLATISRTKALFSGGPNFAYDLCVRRITPQQRDTLDLSSWEVAFNGAEPIRPETLESFAAAFESCGFRKQAFYPCFGLAEATLIASGGLKGTAPFLHTIQATALQHNQVVEVDAQVAGARTLVGCGRALTDQKIVIVDSETRLQCRPEHVGEVWVSGPSIAQGYWNNPQATQHTFQAYLSDTGEGPFMRTGDLGFLHAGELFITGRHKDLIIIRGRNYYPQDIELTMEQSHPALQPGSGAAFSVEVEGEERLVAVQEIRRSHRNIDAEEVAQAIRTAVAEEHELQAYAVVLLRPMSISKTSSGKIQRAFCRTQFIKGKLEMIGMSCYHLKDAAQACAPRPRLMTAYVPPNSAIQQQLVEIWQEVLKVEPIGLDDSFFELGGDSMLAVQIFYRVRDAFKVNFQLTNLLQQATVASMAHYIETVHQIAQDQVTIEQDSDREKIQI